MKTYYEDGQIILLCGDSRGAEVDVPGCLIVDPPYDDDGLLDAPLPRADSMLVFTDPRNMGRAVDRFGPMTWTFTWDTMSSWTTGERRPLQQTKHALWYGELDSYKRDGALWGEPPPARDHPTTRQKPADGRRLTDLWRESLRWLHHPGAGNGSAGSERFSSRQGDPRWRHAKPLHWVRCLIANTSEGWVYDPFAGTGTSLLAAKLLGRKAIGIEIDEGCCELAAARLRGDLPSIPVDPDQLSLT